MENTTQNQPKWLTIGQAAKYLGISRDTLRRWEKAGRIKPIRSPTNRRYYTKPILDELMTGKGKAKISKLSHKKPSFSLTIGKTPKLILAGIISLIAAALLGILLQTFILK
jgi:excisionase family DNA binding protein